jgi:hypothetical protein
LFWIKQRFCSISRNSGEDFLGQTEILLHFQKFWNRCFGSNRYFVLVPETLELMFCVKRRYCVGSRNSGILVFGSNRDSVAVPESLEPRCLDLGIVLQIPVSGFSIPEYGIGRYHTVSIPYWVSALCRQSSLIFTLTAPESRESGPTCPSLVCTNFKYRYRNSRYRNTGIILVLYRTVLRYSRGRRTIDLG